MKLKFSSHKTFPSRYIFYVQTYLCLCKMSETENLQNLKQISSTVSERDLKIWENVAHSTCKSSVDFAAFPQNFPGIQKHTDKLKSEIARMKAAAVEKKQENRILKEQLAELEQTIAMYVLVLVSPIIVQLIVFSLVRSKL